MNRHRHRTGAMPTLLTGFLKSIRQYSVLARRSFCYIGFTGGGPVTG
jgi:hypothetical protein